MIALARDRNQVPSAFAGTNRVKRELKLLIAKRDGTLGKLFDKNTLWKGAKDQLRAESKGKCAYCEGLGEVVAHCDVEHFRPKSVWWWLALCYDNYVFGCQICNQSYKSDYLPIGATRHPEPVVSATASDADLKNNLAGRLAPDPVDLANASGYQYASYQSDCMAEGALLLNPYEEKPEDYLAYDAIPALREVRVIPLSPAAKARIEACEKYYGLNRETLARARWNTYKILEKTHASWQAVGFADKPGIEAIMKDMMGAEMAFAGMCRYFVRTLWQIPGL